MRAEVIDLSGTDHVGNVSVDASLAVLECGAMIPKKRRRYVLSTKKVIQNVIIPATQTCEQEVIDLTGTGRVGDVSVDASMAVSECGAIPQKRRRYMLSVSFTIVNYFIYSQ